jgi:heme exporter protein B
MLFSGVSFDLQSGDAAIVTGPNGVGKSSLIRIAASLLAPFEGSVACEGAKALLTEASALDPDRTLIAALRFWAALDDAPVPHSRPPVVDRATPPRVDRAGCRQRGAGLAARRTGQRARHGFDRSTGNADRRAPCYRRHRAGRHAPAAGDSPRAGDRVVIALIRRDLRRSVSSGGATLVVAFFLLVATLFPFAIGPDGALLARIGGGVIWTAALLAALLPVERLVGPDLEAGVFDQFVVRGMSLALVALAKTIAHWLSFGPPLMLAAVIAAGLLNLSADTLLRVEVGLLIGTPGLAALAVATSALVAGVRGGGAVTGLVMLPLAVPLLIFGAGSLDPAGGAGAVKLLAAVSLVLVAGAPFLAAAAIRAGMD